MPAMIRSAVVFLVLAGSACGSRPDLLSPAGEAPPERPRGSPAFEFEGIVDAASGTIEVTRTFGTSANALQPAEVVQDGTAGSGPADSVEMVTTNIGTDGACGFMSSFCADVTIRSFY